MAITFPTNPGPADAVASLVRYGRETQPPAGGVVQMINRLGSRYRLEVSLPPMSYATARAVLAARLKSANEGQTVVVTWPQETQASLGAPLINGAGQLGSVLVCDGFTPGAVIPALAFFSFSAGGRIYLHSTVGQVTANGSGQASIPIAPMLRASPADNAALNFTAPQIEGFLGGGDVDWSLNVLKHVGVRFVITENR